MCIPHGCVDGLTNMYNHPCYPLRTELDSETCCLYTGHCRHLDLKVMFVNKKTQVE